MSLPPGTRDVQVRPRGLSGWIAEVMVPRDGDDFSDLRRMWRHGATEEAALRSLQAALRGHAERTGHVPVLPGTSLDAAAETWLNDLIGHVGETTLYTQRRRYASLVSPYLGRRTLAELTPLKLDAYFHELEDSGLAAGTRRNVRNVLMGIFRMAMGHGAITFNPLKDIARITEKRRRPKPRAFTDDELDCVLAAFDEIDRARPARELGEMARFMLGTGVRIGELLAVRWRDLDLDQGILRITGNLVRVHGVGLIRHEGKTSSATRTVALPESLCARLAELQRRRAYARPDDPVFHNRKWTYRDPKLVLDQMRGGFAAANVRWATSHAFRKTYATILDEAGRSPREIADQLGHSDPNLTLNVYMGRGRAPQKRPPDALERIIGGDREGAKGVGKATPTTDRIVD